MIKNVIIVCFLLSFGLALTGCGGSTPEKEPAQNAVSEADSAKTLEDFQREAQQEITAENAEGELERLEAEIKADDTVE